MVVGVTEAARSPWFNMVQQDNDGFLNILLGNEKHIRRQDTPEIFDMTTVAYVSRPKFIANSMGIFLET